MGTVGVPVFVDFWVFDDKTPVPGRTLSDWWPLFYRNNEECGDVLTVTDHGDGHYTISYTPSYPGHTYLRIYDPLYDCSTIDIEDIEQSDLIANASTAGLNQDYGTINALQVKLPNPSQYTLWAFTYSDWVLGNRDTRFAEGSTALDNQGNWINGLPLTPDTYT